MGLRHVTYFADRIGTMVQVFALSPGKFSFVCVRKPKKFTAALSKFHVGMAPALDDLPAHQIRSVEGTRRIRVESWSRVST